MMSGSPMRRSQQPSAAVVRGLPAMLVALSVLAACSRSEPAGQPADWTAPPPMQKPEQERGTQACSRYVARVCACAQSAPELAEQCQLARSQPEALAVLLAMVNGKQGKLGQREFREAQVTARKIVRDCFESDAALDPRVCPRSQSRGPGR
jgi:hypothetical protein